VQHNAYLTFSFNLHTRKITSCARHPEEVGVELSAFLGDHVSASALSDPDVQFNYIELEEFLTREGGDRTMIVNSVFDGRSYRFVAYPSRHNEKIIYCSMFVEAAKKNSDLYIYDYLTGVYNCAYAVSSIEKRFAEVEKGALLILDVDNFKRVNDSFGRTMGDECLREMSAEIKKIVDGALIGRYGGDEFIIWIENKTESEVKKIVQRLLAITYASTDGTSYKVIKVTCSIGVAFFPEDSNGFLKLLTQAEQAVSRAKKLGRNSAILFGKNILLRRSDERIINEKKKRVKNEKLFEGVLKRVKLRCIILCVAAAIIFVALTIFVGAYYRLEKYVPLFVVMILLSILLVASVGGTIVFANLGIRNLRLRYVDPITGGINRARLIVDAHKLIKRGKYAVVSINVVNFKFLNEQMGRDTANGILFKIYRDIQNSLGDDELVAREYADRFTVIMRVDNHLNERISSLNSALTNAKHAGSEQTLKFTVGVYVLPEINGANNVADLAVGFDRAYFALMQADESDNNIVYFNDSMLSKEIESVALEQRSEQALREGRFVVYYQMKRDIIKDGWCGAEALVRWIDPVEGMISPGKFIPIFEKNDFILELDRYVFYEVCRDIRVDLDGGKAVLPISINVSRRHFINEDFLDDYEKIMRQYSIPRSLIEFELTESIVMENAVMLKKFVRRVHEMGCTCSIDDFGSGYSSLNMLKEFNFDVVKFDRGFFYGDNGFDSDSQTIVFSLIKLSHDLGMKVVSEGIEHEEQKDFLLKHKCDIVQGFLYSKPMPHSEYVKYLEDSVSTSKGA